MTKHERSRAKRRAIAKAVSLGATTAEASNKYGVTVSTVWAACAEHGVKIPRQGQRGPKPRSLRILRALWDGRSVKDAAFMYAVTINFVNRLKGMAAENGWPELKNK